MKTCLRKIGIRAAAILFAASVSLALLFTACSNNAGGNKGGGTPASVSYRIIFSVDGGHGTLKAKAEGVAETDKSPISAEKDKAVTFIAKPDAGYKVTKWAITGGTFEAGTGTNGSLTAKVKITANTEVKVGFEELPPGSYTVKHYQEKTEGGYPAEPTENEILSGTPETNAQYTPKTYEGFTYKPALTKVNGTVQGTGTIAADNSTVVELYYERNTVNVTFKLAGGNIGGNTNDVVRSGKYGTDLTLPVNPEKTGFVFKEWNPAPPSPLVFPAADTQYTAVWASLYIVTFSVGGTGGTLKATAEGVAETATRPISVEKGKTVTFTADPATGYKVDKWTITPASALQEGGTAGSTTAKVKITAATTVNVSFTLNTYTVTFNATPPNGTLKAELAGSAIASGQPVEYGKTVTFTAAPASDYKVDTWTITRGTFEEGGTPGSTTAKVKITAATTVNVSFTLNTYTVTFGTPANGTLKAEIAGTVITSGDTVEYGKTVTFTAVPAEGYKADTWTITPAAALQEGGTPGSTTAKVKITVNTNVNVTFTSLYEPVAFGVNGTDLDTYLKNAAPHIDGICYIKVTGLTPADLKGDSSNYTPKPGALGKILKDNPTKKVALKLEEIPGLTDMTACFYGCTSLIQAPVIQNGVTNMECCFRDCTSLAQAPVIPNGVTNMRGCFSGCTSLTQAPVIPNGVTDIIGCFSGCYRLTQAPVIPESVTNMTNCFSICQRLTQAPVIPNGVTDMYNCFYGCTSLTQAPAIPSSVTNMNKCFFGCQNLYYAPVFAASASVTDMTSCFESCESLTQAPVLPNGVTNMESCFSRCYRLTQAPVIPESVTNMTNCFFGCTSLTQAPVIPSSVTNMTRCFESCEKLYHAPVFAASASVTDMKCCFQGCKRLVSAPTIPNGVTNMFGCFSDCKSLTRAPVIPNGVTDMRFCFSGCGNLTLPPTIPNSVTRMSGCFEGCESLTYANEIPSSVTNMSRCFQDCKNLTFVTLKCDYVAGNFNEAFSRCTKLTAGSIKVPADQLQTYRNNATIMGALKDRFIAE